MLITDLDKQNIIRAIEAKGDIWNNPILNEVKSKIKEYFLKAQCNCCCYCRRPLKGEFKMVLDIEHILPKCKFGCYMFNFTNIAVSCKRCNIKIKGKDVSFFSGNVVDSNSHFVSNNYLFIHPNLDEYYNYIEFYVSIVNNKRIIKYIFKSEHPKGLYTYNYFRLNELELDSFDEAQGIEVERLSELIDPETSRKIEELLKTS